MEQILWVAETSLYMFILVPWTWCTRMQFLRRSKCEKQPYMYRCIFCQLLYRRSKNYVLFVGAITSQQLGIVGFPISFQRREIYTCLVEINRANWSKVRGNCQYEFSNGCVRGDCAYYLRNIILLGWAWSNTLIKGTNYLHWLQSYHSIAWACDSGCQAGGYLTIICTKIVLLNL